MMNQPPARRRRVAVVVQRWGDGVAGGAEVHARLLVGALKAQHDITVLTSCARDADRWAMHFAPGASAEDGVAIERFAHPPRNEGGRAQVPLANKWRWWLRAVFDAIGRVRVAPPRGDDEADGHLFLRRQGPTCEGLVEALRRGHERWDVVVFFTALYHPTAEGLPVWGRRSVLVPTLHDEKPMHLPWFRRVFGSAGMTLWNTAAEQRLARRLYGDSAAVGRVVGAGVKVVAPTSARIAETRRQGALPERYLVYVGRLEKGKGCADLLAAWWGVAEDTGDAALVFVGTGTMQIATSARVRVTGWLDADERDALVCGARALVMPSRHESLSLVLLEAFALGVPALVNGRCEPLADHIAASGAGEAYRSARGLRAGLLRALARPAAERARLGEAGRRYVAEHYAPEQVAQAWLDAVEAACAS